MKFNHLVKYNGKYYPAGTNVPVGEKPVEVKIEKDVEEKKEESLTKTEINRMSTAELKALAKKEEIYGSEEMTGSELKKILIEKYGL